jgi:hypothetical protein
MQRTIIVQQGRTETNNERFYLSIKDKPGKPPTLKMQQVYQANPVFDELEIFMEITKISKTPHA